MRLLKLAASTLLVASISTGAQAVVMTYELGGYNTSQSTIIHLGAGSGGGTHQWQLDATNAGNTTLTTLFDDVDNNGLSNGDTLSSSGTGTMHFNALSGNVIGSSADAVLTWGNLSGTLANGTDAFGHRISSISFDWTLAGSGFSYSGAAMFSDLQMGMFNHVALNGDELRLTLWGAFYQPTSSSDVFDEFDGLGIDFTVRGDKVQVPEPSVIALFAMGLLGLGLYRRKT